jgi:hypothetical protein
MTAAHITGLAEMIADLADTIDDTIGSVTMGEMADGSGRSYAIVNTYDEINELEQEFRVASPATDNSPKWAKDSYTDWTIEVLVGSVWQHLTLA